MDPSQLPLRQTEPFIHLSLADCLLRKLTPEQMGAAFLSLIDDKTHPKVIIGLEDVEYLSSATLGMLLMIRNAVEKRQGRICLASIGPRIKDLFALTMLDRKFQIVPDVPAARAAMEQPQ